MIERYDLIVIGAGPAGLSAAIEAAKNGMRPIVFDENAKPGGQLFKQIHKFFGSKEHKAKIRGFNIGYELLEEANKLGVDVRLNATVVGLYDEKEVTVRIGDEIKHFKGDSVLVATGQREHGNLQGLDTSGSHRRRCRPDYDESSSHKAGQQDTDARIRKCRTCRQLSAHAGWL